MELARQIYLTVRSFEPCQLSIPSSLYGKPIHLSRWGYHTPPGRGTSLKMDAASCYPSVTTAVSGAVRRCSQILFQPQSMGAGVSFPLRSAALSPRPAASNPAPFFFHHPRIFHTLTSRNIPTGPHTARATLP